MTEGDTRPAAQEEEQHESRSPDGDGPVAMPSRRDTHDGARPESVAGSEPADSLSSRLAAAEALVAHLTQERDAAVAERDRQTDNALQSQAAFQRERDRLATLHREQATLVEQLIVELREIAEGFRAADAETLLSFLDSFEHRLTKPTSLSQEPSDP